MLAHRKLDPGDVLFEQGEPADQLAIVLSGSLLVTAVMSDGSVIPLGRVCPGEVVGEMGLLDGAPRSGTVSCKRTSWLLLPDRALYDQMLGENDPLLPWILELAARGLAHRIGAMTERIAQAAIDPHTLHELPDAPVKRARSWWAWFDRRGRRA